MIHHSIACLFVDNLNRAQGVALSDGCRKDVSLQGVTPNVQTVSANCQCLSGNDYLSLTTIDTDLKQVIEAWNVLSEHIQQSILSLIETEGKG